VTPPPPEVGVIVTQAAETPLPFEYAGRVAGFRNVEVRPRVGGLLLTREYVEGGKATCCSGSIPPPTKWR
jgi:membrane fusion protein (multidrug efflux system)